MAFAATACATVPPSPAVAPADLPRTRAETSDYTETSTHADVRAFLDSLRTLRAPLTFGVMGTTAGGRAIPYVIAARPGVSGAAEGRSLGRPVVFVQGNIHGGEVEGKEALLMLLRDLAFEPRANVLDSIALIAVPIYNADGNDALGPQETHRPEQNGPASIGRRANAAGLDLNRDYLKADAPETQALLALFNEWDPDVFVDLHTTNGSLHGYALTYSPPLNPASPLEDTARDWLNVLRERVRTRHRFETFDYGNFGGDATPWQDRQIYTPAVRAWTTFDHRPRFSTNYYGLRGRIGILAEAYSHDPFERRVSATYAFVRELLSLVAERGAEVQAQRIGTELPGGISVRARFTTSPRTLPVLVEDVELTGDSIRTEPGLRPGLRRTGRFRAVAMPVYDRFESVTQVRTPVSYVYPTQLQTVSRMLALHGIAVQSWDSRATAGVEEFLVDSIVRSARPFEGRHEVRVFGRWVAAQALPATDFQIVPVTGARAPLIAYLLDAESDDGLATWALLDEHLRQGQPFPIRRLNPQSSAGPQPAVGQSRGP